jgi:NADH-quinone oxidoreductase subunit N
LLGSIAGLGRHHLWIAIAVTLGLLNLAGVPPLAGSIGQLALLRTAIENGPRWPIWPLMINTPGAWLLVGQWMAKIWQDSTQRQTQTTPNPAIAVLFLVSMAGLLITGLYAEAILNWLTSLAAG